MEINKILEALNEVLSSKDLTIWLHKEEIKDLKAENEKLKAEIEKLQNELDFYKPSTKGE